MKYTNYLINGNYIDVESVTTNRKFLKYPLILVLIVASVVGIVAISGVLPMAFVVDEYRNTKYRLIKFKRHGYKFT